MAGLPYKREELFAEDLLEMFDKVNARCTALEERVQQLEDLNRDGVVDEKDNMIRDAILAFVMKDNPQLANVVKLAATNEDG